MFYLTIQVGFIILLECYCESTQTPLEVRDVCQMSSVTKLLHNYTFKASTPMGGLSTGTYERYNDTDFDDCFMKCCENRRCNVAWNWERVCITFECDWYKFDNCKPRLRVEKKYQSAILLLLRSPIQPNHSPGGTGVVEKRTQGGTTVAVNTTISTNAVNVLQVDTSGNQTLILPVNYVTLTARVNDDKDSRFLYQWSLLSKPLDKNSGKMDATNTNELKLTDLVVGEYQFQVEVRGHNSFGKANVSVFVQPAKKPNQPPRARIVPNKQTVQLPNNVILDGSKSSDDDSIVSYYWEQVMGPIEADKKIKNDQSMLNLENLSAGNYTFKLTVKDASGAPSSDTAYLIVLAEKDYPPQADAGNNIIVELPVKFVVLNGSGSRDDKKIVSYQWTKKSDGLTADTQGVREPILNLTNLQEGTYTFNLKVTDSAGQQSDKDVQVFVKPRTNYRPVARASVTDDKTVIVHLPATEALLNGSLSSDDEMIIQYHWEQIGGVPRLNLVNAEKPIAYVYDLKIGVFQFNLTVFDKEKMAHSDTVTLRINESKNQKPQAKIVKVPDYHHLDPNLVKIDGSTSWDDVKIVQYKWTREDDSSAVGQVLDNSLSSSILMLTDLYPGLYKFKLQVIDAEGLFDTSVASLTILPSKYERNLVELQFICSPTSFIESRKNALVSNIQQIVQKKLNKDTSKVVIHVVQLEKAHFENIVTIVFYASLNQVSQSTSTKSLAVVDTPRVWNTSSIAMVNNNSLETTMALKAVDDVFVDALEVVDALGMLPYNSASMEYEITRVETYVCQNECSGHGRCQQTTRLCECETFWTGSLFRKRFGDGRSNCDWSVIYLVIFGGVVLLSLGLSWWFFIWIRQRRHKSRKSIKTRNQRYMKLGYEERVSVTCKLPKSLPNGVKSRVSSERLVERDTDSSMTSDEEVQHFVSKVRRASTKTANGGALKTL